MKQVLGRSDGVLVARMPAPGVGPRDVLVRNHFSLISTGTETASMKAGASAPVAPPADGLYLLQHLPVPDLKEWPVVGGAKILEGGARPTVQTDSAEHGYAFGSPPIALEPGSHHAFSAHIKLLSGNVSLGVLAADGSAWLATQCFNYPQPELSFRLDVDTPAQAGAPSLQVKLMFSNHRPGDPKPSSFQLLEVTHINWKRSDAPGSPSEPRKAQSEPRYANWLQKVTGILGGGVGVGIKNEATAFVPAADLPLNEMAQQGFSLGYSCAGEVVSVGSAVTEFAPGDRVACAGAGRASHAELVSVPVNLVAKLPPGVDARSGCSATVGAIALQGVRRANPQLGERVVVIGLGLIGQLTVQLAKAAGCKVLGFDPLEERVQLALKRGLDEGASTEPGISTVVSRLTGGHGADICIVTAATQSDAPINLAMALCRRRGRVVLSGDVDIHPKRQAFYQKEIDLLMATSYGPGRYDPAYEDEGRDYPYAYVRWTTNRNMQSYLELLAAGKVEFRDLIDAEYNIDQAPAAYQQLLSSARKPLAVLLRYADPKIKAHAVPAEPRVVLKGGAPLRAGPLNFVLVGAGAFGQSMLAPKMLALPKLFQFYGVASRNQAQGGNFARSLGVSHIASDMRPFLDDPNVHLFVIATRHHEHAEQAMLGLRAGKHVFVEKPLAITWEQLNRFVADYDALASRPALMVGFNRRFSPALVKLREILATRRAPLMINYRINAGRVPLESWVQGAHGGGRNIGEACHMYDVFRSIANAPVESVHALPIAQRPSDTLPNDNFVATIRYQDGSIATLTYTAQGPKEGLPKERIEVFCGGEAYIVDDFCKLLKAGAPAPLWEGTVDKGHAMELQSLGESILNGAPAPISPEEIFETTALALKIEEALK